MRVVDAILSEPWAMLPERVAEMLSIAERSSDDLEAVVAKMGRPLDNTRNVTHRDGVAVIPVTGPICRRMNMFSEISGGTSVQCLATDLRTALDDPEIHSVILDIDSPGGTVAGIGELAAHIHEGSQRKPVVCYVSSMGCSAAYWLASAGSEVVAAPSAILGSVGVIYPVARKDGNGRTLEFVSSQSPNKVPNPETESGRANIQATVDAMAKVFIDSVAEYREVTPEDVVKKFGAGGVLIGQAAVDAGMADRLGSLEGLIAELSGGPADDRHHLHHGGAAAGNEGQESMKINVSSLFTRWFQAGKPDVMDVSADASAEGTQLGGLTYEASSVAIPPAIDIEAIVAKATAQARADALAEASASAKADRDKMFATHAESWFAEALAAGHVTPDAKDLFTARYVDAATSDAERPFAAMAATGGRLGALKAEVAAKPVQRTVGEYLPADASRGTLGDYLAKNGLKVMSNAATTPEEADAKASNERVLAALQGSEIGRSVLAETTK